MYSCEVFGLFCTAAINIAVFREAAFLTIKSISNSGKHHGDADGFTLASLHRLADVKSSTKPNRNLLHYLLALIDRQFPDVLRIKRDLSSVFEAARVRLVRFICRIN